MNGRTSKMLLKFANATGANLRQVKREWHQSTEKERAQRRLMIEALMEKRPCPDAKLDCHRQVQNERYMNKTSLWERDYHRKMMIALEKIMREGKR